VTTYLPGDRIGDHWTVVSAPSPKKLLVQCSCGELRLHGLRMLVGPGDVCRSCGCQKRRVNAQN